MLKTVFFLLIISMIAMMLKCLPFIFNFPLHYRKNFPLMLPSTIAFFDKRNSKHPSTLRSSVSLERNDSNHVGCSCRSNQTHIVWHESTHESIDGGCSCLWQTIQEAKRDAYLYLQKNIMEFDQAFYCTLGFHDSHNADIDGLSDGLIGPVIDLSYQAKIRFPHTDVVPRPIFMEYILNYANVNESRNNIRSLLWEKLIRPLFLSSSEVDDQNLTVADVVRIINTKMWNILAPSHTNCITFVSGQTPLIFDPMSVLSFGYGGCTGLSLLFVQALRAAGVPARVAGTAAWNQDMEHGNHNWVELWLPASNVQKSTTTYNDDFGGSWLFIEASANQSAVDNIDDWSPCTRWFCSPSRMENGTQFYAAKLERCADHIHFPLAWDARNLDVPAVNRTLYYHSICSECQ